MWREVTGRPGVHDALPGLAVPHQPRADLLGGADLQVRVLLSRRHPRVAQQMPHARTVPQTSRLLACQHVVSGRHLRYTSASVAAQGLEKHAGQLAERLHRQVVLVCQSGTRATQAQQRLAGAGVEHLHVLDGGVAAYRSAGGEVVEVRARWPLERQVRLVAGSC